MRKIKDSPNPRWCMISHSVAVPKFEDWTVSGPVENKSNPSGRMALCTEDRPVQSPSLIGLEGPPCAGDETQEMVVQVAP